MRPLRDVVAVRCPHVLDEYYGVILSTIERGACASVGKILLLSAEAAEGGGPSLPGLLRSEITEDAVLILPPGPGTVLAGLHAGGYPFVVVDPRTSLPPATH